jgi:hypothetical protein
VIGLPTPLVEVATGGSPGALLALVFAAGGAIAGWLVAGAR